MEHAIVVSGLSKRYRFGKPSHNGSFRDLLTQRLSNPFRRSGRRQDWFWALKDISFKVGQGEVLGIIGRNGAGKSTLLKILSRITEPTSGNAQIDGRVGSLLEVGTGFHPELSGRENIFLNGAILGMKRNEITRKLDEIVAFAENEKFIDTPVKHYSSGMYVRLAFAVAAHLETEILIVDEVLAVGDGEFQKKCMGKMEDAAQGGRTILFVSHNMNSIRTLTKNCIWLDSGTIRMIGPSAKAVSAYESNFAQKTSQHTNGVKQEHAQFLRWGIVEPKTQDPHALNGCGPVKIRFWVQINRPIQKGYHAIALRDPDNRIMWSFGIYDLSLEKGAHEFEYALPTLPLRPGPYFWQVKLYGEQDASSGWKLLDEWQGIPELNVATPPLTHPDDSFSGILNIPCEFKIAERVS